MTARRSAGTPNHLKAKYWRLRTRYLRTWRLFRFRLTHRGRSRFCNICGWQGSQFLSTDDAPDATCPYCLSLARHRLLKAVLDERNEPVRGSRILHVSPKGELGLVRRFRSISSTYVNIDKGGVWNDFFEGNAMVQMDLTRLAFSENSFDFVMCSHVLENIRDDRKAIAEVHRVLAPGRLAALQVQLYGETTERIENPTAEDYYHVWHPGLDYFARYEEAGFSVRLYNGNRPEKEALGLYPRLVVPICVKLPQ